MTTKYHNMSNVQLYKALDGARIDTDNGIRESCIIIQELKRRSETIPVNIRTGVFKYFREIAADQLSPAAVLEFLDNQKLLAMLKGVSIATQRSYADGLKVEVATVNAEGSVSVKSIDFRALPSTAYDIVLSPSGQRRTPEEQAAILNERMAKACERRSTVPAGPRVEAIKYNDSITVNGVEVEAARICAVMAELGYTFTKAATDDSKPWTKAA